MGQCWEEAHRGEPIGLGLRLRRLGMKNPRPVPTHPPPRTLKPGPSTLRTVQDLEASLESAAAELGLRLRCLDKKSEKAALAAQRARLLAALALEGVPANALALALPLVVLKATGKAGLGPPPPRAPNPRP